MQFAYRNLISCQATHSSSHIFLFNIYKHVFITFCNYYTYIMNVHVCKVELISLHRNEGILYYTSVTQGIKHQNNLS